METKKRQIPPGPQNQYKTAEGLLSWMNRQFAVFGDIYKASVYGCGAYVIRDPEFAHHVLVENSENYVKGQITGRVEMLLGKGLMVSEGALWKKQRRMIQPAFSHKSIGALMGAMRTVNSELLTKWQTAASRNESVNVTRDVSSMALEIVLRFIFGNDYAQVGPRFDLLTKETARNMAFAAEFRALKNDVLDVMGRRRKSATTHTDALSMLMEARDPQSGRLMEDAQLIDEILTLIVAGHETTASTLSWTWYLISQHPEIEQKLSNELNELNDLASCEFDDLPKFAYTRQVIEEAMRLYPAGWLLTRRALSDDWLGDYFVPAGTEIYIAIYFIHRHPALWEQPDRFDPDRFRPENSKSRNRLATIPFSAGPRNCIGGLFARIEMQIHIMTIAKHFRLRYAPSRPIELDAGVNLRSKHDFIMHPECKDKRDSAT